MLFKFLGTGSAFNTRLGNNCAYIKKGKALFMIDCGSNIFTRLESSGLLKGVERVFVLMTHTHPDHIGSLGDLVFKGYYEMGTMFSPSVSILAPKALKVRECLRTMLVPDDNYEFAEFEEIGGFSMGDLNVQFKPIKTTHVEQGPSFGYEFYVNGRFYYYSGDSNMIPSEIIMELDKYDELYQDTCGADYPGNVHLSLKKLAMLIAGEDRKKFYCMHLDKSFNVTEARKLGFNVCKNTL